MQSLSGRMADSQSREPSFQSFSLSFRSLTIFFLSTVHQFTFSPFAAISLCGVAGLAETIPSFPVSDPFLPDVPGFQVPPDSIFPPRLRSSSRALPLHLHFNNCSDVFSFIFLLTCPDYSSVLLLITIAIGSTFTTSKISSFLRCSNKLTPRCPSHHSHLCCPSSLSCIN